MVLAGVFAVLAAIKLGVKQEVKVLGNALITGSGKALMLAGM